MTERTQRLLAEFLELVQINCSSRAERPMADALIPKLQALGFSVEEDNAGQTIGGNAGNVIARLAGPAPGPTLLLCAHMDRVTPGQNIQPTVVDGVIRSDGTTILAADDVSGLVAILEGVRRAQEDGVQLPSLEVVFTIAEEGGLFGAKACDASQLHADMGFFFDSNGPVGTIIVQAPSQNSMEFVVEGRAAHAGVNPEAGINALQIAAQGVAAMKLGRIDAETTANIGVFQAGSATNIVPDRATLKGEARSLDPEKLEKQTDHMVACLRSAAQAGGALCQETVNLSYPGYRFEEDHPVVQRAVQAAKAARLDVTLKGTGGGSDANVFNGKGIPSLVFGMGYTDVHSTKESLPVAELERSAQLVYTLIGGTLQ